MVSTPGNFGKLEPITDKKDIPDTSLFAVMKRLEYFIKLKMSQVGCHSGLLLYIVHTLIFPFLVFMLFAGQRAVVCTPRWPIVGAD